MYRGFGSVILTCILLRKKKLELFIKIKPILATGLELSLSNNIIKAHSGE